MDERLNEFINQCIYDIAQGDESGIDKIYHALQGKMFTIAFRYVHVQQDIEAIINLVLLKIVRAAGSYNYNTNSVAWILTILKNTCIDFIRERGKIIEIALNESAVKHASVTHEVDDTVEKLLSKLKPSDRKILILKHAFKYTYDEIAVKVKIPRGTVYYREQRAIKKLRKLKENIF